MMMKVMMAMTILMMTTMVLTWDHAMKKGGIPGYLTVATSQKYCSWLTPALLAGLSQVSSLKHPQPSSCCLHVNYLNGYQNKQRWFSSSLSRVCREKFGSETKDPGSVTPTVTPVQVQTLRSVSCTVYVLNTRTILLTV